MGMVINNSPPCKGCEIRYQGCHSNCEWFADWKNEQEEKKKVLYGERKRTSMLNDFYVDSCRKQIKRNGRKI